MMIHGTVFDDLTSKDSGKVFKKPPKHYRELAKLYYDQASAYHKRIYRKKTGVGEVLEKLSKHYEAYQGVLKNVRREYFNFLNSFRDQVFTSFMKGIGAFEGEFMKKSKMDEFLDIYAEWLNTKNPVLELKIQQLAQDIKAVDPGFNFDMSRMNRSGWTDDERKCA